MSTVEGAAPNATPGFVDATEYFRNVRSLGSASRRQRAELAARFVLDLDRRVLRPREEQPAPPAPAGSPTQATGCAATRRTQMLRARRRRDRRRRLVATRLPY